MVVDRLARRIDKIEKGIDKDIVDQCRNILRANSLAGAVGAEFGRTAVRNSGQGKAEIVLPPKRERLSSNEVAKEYGFSPKQLRQWRYLGKKWLPWHTRLNGSVFYFRDEVEEALKKFEQPFGKAGKPT